MRNKYTVSEFFGNAKALLITKMFYRPARLVRRPVYIRGKKSLVIGKGLTMGHACRFDLSGEGKTLFIGENCEMGDNVHIVAHERVTIGNNVLIASKIFISDTDHGIYKGEKQCPPDMAPNDRPLVTSPVEIGDNVWIGENAVILSGCRIGEGCIIGANSTVVKDVPANCIVAGSPAKIIKRYDRSDGVWKRTDSALENTEEK